RRAMQSAGLLGLATVAGVLVTDLAEPLARGDLAVSGADLAEAGIPPGPAVGRVLEALLGLVLEDPGLNRRDVLLARARELS
ncbi:MAG TPA: hypothetical protein VLA95_07380, partial [Gemmatimonadales bacterium]|nr:hypothetical protein [Gemmatimonadales bacterium]